ncbi:MAG: hypothetical protein J6E46_07760 [Faecalicoccus sp.]|nr:hypothetical protein [Faecalicoccus sp.]
MSFVIYKKCSEGVCFASDTLQRNRRTGRPYDVHKLTFDKEKKAVLGFVGYTIKYMYGPNVYLREFGKSIFSIIGTHKDIEIVQWIKGNICNYLKEAKDIKERNIQYIYYHKNDDFDMESATIEYPAFETSNIYDPKIHGDSYSIGQTSEQYNEKHLLEDNSNKSLKEIKSECIEAVQSRIDDSAFSNVGGHVEWITIDKEGNVKTNIGSK